MKRLMKILMVPVAFDKVDSSSCWESHSATCRSEGVRVSIHVCRIEVHPSIPIPPLGNVNIYALITRDQVNICTLN